MIRHNNMRGTNLSVHQAAETIRGARTPHLEPIDVIAESESLPLAKAVGVSRFRTGLGDVAIVAAIINTFTAIAPAVVAL